MHIYKHTYIHTYIHTDIYIYMHTYTHIYIYIQGGGGGREGGGTLVPNQRPDFSGRAKSCAQRPERGATLAPHHARHAYADVC